MRPAVAVGLAAFAIVAGLMLHTLLTGGDCPGGTEVRSLQACIAGGRTPERCAALMAEANAGLSRSGPHYPTREACQDRHLTCQESASATGYVPRATGFCLAAGTPEKVVPRFPPGGG